MVIVKGCAYCLRSTPAHSRSSINGSSNSSSNYIGTATTAGLLIAATKMLAGSITVVICHGLLLPFRYTDGAGGALSCITFNV